MERDINETDSKIHKHFIRKHVPGNRNTVDRYSDRYRA
jgi:hypothetical protein